MRKDIVIFGTGSYFENYMLCYGSNPEKRPLFAVDNAPEKQGTEKMGVLIKAPQSLKELPPESFYVVICCAAFHPIEKQLEELGVMDVQYYQPIPMERAMCYTLVDGKLCPVSWTNADEKPYEIGYVPGVFDLFHVGHLNLLRNAKSRCAYLIAGVLTDELVEYFKKRTPVIPYAQRAAVVSAIEYVDRVVPVDFSNTYKIDAWRRYHFDCHFSGNDHGADWTEDLRKLREVGSNMEFFEYTGATSSTKIREALPILSGHAGQP